MDAHHRRDFGRACVGDGFLPASAFVTQRRNEQRPRSDAMAGFPRGTFLTPVSGPMAFGFGAHFGLGLLVPDELDLLAVKWDRELSRDSMGCTGAGQCGARYQWARAELANILKRFRRVIRIVLKAWLRPSVPKRVGLDRPAHNLVAAANANELTFE